MFDKSGYYGSTLLLIEIPGECDLCVLLLPFVESRMPLCCHWEPCATCNQYIYLRGSCWETGHRWEDRSQSKGSDPTHHLLTETEKTAAWRISALTTFTLSLASSSLEVQSFEPVMRQRRQPELPRMSLSLTFISLGQIVILNVTDHRVSLCKKIRKQNLFLLFIIF